MTLEAVVKSLAVATSLAVAAGLKCWSVAAVQLVCVEAAVLRVPALDAVLMMFVAALVLMVPAVAALLTSLRTFRNILAAPGDAQVKKYLRQLSPKVSTVTSIMKTGPF